VKASQEKETVIEGVLIPTAWGSNGDVSQVSLMTFDESEYRIDSAAAETHGLLSHLRRSVRCRGSVRGDRVVEIKSLELLDAPDRNSVTGTT